MRQKHGGNVGLMKLLLQGWKIVRVQDLSTSLPLTQIRLGIQTSGFGRPSYWKIIYV